MQLLKLLMLATCMFAASCIQNRGNIETSHGLKDTANSHKKKQKVFRALQAVNHNFNKPLVINLENVITKYPEAISFKIFSGSGSGAFLTAQAAREKKRILVGPPGINGKIHVLVHHVRDGKHYHSVEEIY